MRRGLRRAALVVLLATAPVFAKGPDPQAKGLADDLASRDAARLERALRQIGGAHPLALGFERSVLDLLAGGLPTDLAKLAIAFLGEAGHENSADVVAIYARHRDPETRRAACIALGSMKGKTAEAALKRALADAEAPVRGAAAESLGRFQNRADVPDLFAALGSGVASAEPALADLCRAEECDRVISGGLALPFEVQLESFDRMLFRERLPLGKRLALARVLHGIGGDLAARYAASVRARGLGTPELRDAIDGAGK